MTEKDKTEVARGKEGNSQSRDSHERSRNMMDGTDKHLRDSLGAIMAGEWDSHFTKEQLEFARKESFLLNHLRHEEGKAIFEYEDVKIKYGFDCDPTDLQLYSGDLNMQINSMIRNDESFQKAYNSFLRDWKISNILD